MKFKIAGIVIAMALVAGLMLQSGGTDAYAADEAAIVSSGLTMASFGATEYEFLGHKKCKMCHKEQYKSWEGTTHAKALEVLKPGERKEAKEKYKLDPAKDYTTDKACLECHATGSGKKGGYEIPAEGDEKAAKKAEKLAGVGCESCHGAGDGYCEAKKAIKKAFKADGTKYKLEDLVKVGLIDIKAETCTHCHNDKSPTYDESKKFDFEKMVKTEAAIHAHTELEMREK